MHATYCFLVQVEVGESGAVSHGGFDTYTEYYCDDNNWWREEALVLEDGTLFPLCSADDYLGRYDLQEELADIPQDEHWACAVKIAEDCAISELRWGLAGFFDYDLKKVEHINLDNFEGIVRGLLGDHSAAMDAYRIKWIGTVLQQLEYMEQQPFSGLVVDPYKSIRAMDLCDGQDGPRGILFVDIHT